MRHQAVLAAILVASAPLLRAESMHDVVWVDPVGVSISGNTLTKTGSAGWNAGATSGRFIETTGFVEFTATETNSNRAVGLNRGSPGATYTEIDYAIYLASNATVLVYESGTYRGAFGSYASGDRFRLEVAHGAVRYRKNGALFYSSTVAPQFPLLVDVSLDTAGGTVTGARMGTLTWVRDAGVSVVGTTLTKTGIAGWNAGVVSASSIAHGDGFVEFTATETDKSRRSGLSYGDADQDPSDIDFGIGLRNDGTVEIVEAGVSRGTFGSYAAGAVFRVEVLGGIVRYLQDGTLLYTSTLAPQYPLLVDTAFDETGATLSNVRLVTTTWTNATGVSAAEGTLASTGAGGWTSGAYGATTAASGDVFMEFTALETNTSRMAGLGHDDTGVHYSDIEFAIGLSSSGALEVYESGTLAGSFGSYARGDRFRVEAGGGTVRYRKNGVVFYTSGVTPQYPLGADTSFDHPGGAIANVVTGAMVWTAETGAHVWAAGLVKTGATGWNAGAISTRTIGSGDASLEFVATEPTRQRLIGLGNGNGNATNTDVEFGIQLATTAQVYESGTARGSAISYAAGDVFSVDVNSGTVRYRKNGTIFYTSALAPTYPLLGDTSLHTASATVGDVFLRGASETRKVSTPTLSPAPGQYSTPQQVAMSTVTAGAEIRYTTDGTQPTDSSTLYSAPVSINTSATVRAQAFKAGLIPSDTAGGLYDLHVDAPVLTPAAGTYSTPQTVTMSTATSGAVIRYTTDGSEPSPQSTPYTAGVPISQPVTIKAAAFKSGLVSTTTTAAYAFRAATPVLTPPTGIFNTEPPITVSCSTPSAVIRYTLDGSEPTETSTPVASGGAVTVTQSSSLKAKAWRTGWQDSNTATGNYTTKVGTPTLAPAGGTQTATIDVNVSTVTSGATLRYTTTGLEPTLFDPLVPGGTVEIDRSATLKVKGWRSGWTASDSAAASYYFARPPAAAPLIDPPGGTFPAPVLVSISAPSATIRYTTDGGDPTSGSALYRGPFTVAASSTVKARAFRQDHGASLTTSAGFVIDATGVAAPTVTPGTGVYASKVLVTVASATSGATLHYTTDGTDPDEGDPSIASGTVLTVDRAQILKVKAWATGLSPSAVTRADYVITGALSGGGAHFLVLRGDGTVWSFGDNTYGQLGNGTTTSSSVPVAVTGLGDVVAIAAGYQHSLALTRSGSVWAWGANWSGQLGNNSPNPSVPAQVSIGVPVVAIAAGNSHSLAVGNDGAVRAWGNNASGRLGDGTTTQRLTPVATQVLTSGAVSVHAGGDHSLAVKSDGTAWAWGGNASYQLADTGTHTTPYPIAGLSGVALLDAGLSWSMAWKTDGAAWGRAWLWGNNAAGQLGQGVMGSAIATPAAGLADVVAVSGRRDHSLALLVNGTLRAWGPNNLGQLGDGTQTPRASPVPVPGLADVAVAATGHDRSAAIRASGAVYRWGSGYGTAPLAVSGFTVADNAWLLTDADQDGLTAATEYRIGTDPLSYDTNGDGVDDGTAAALGLNGNDPDEDGDGLSYSAEIAQGTDPFNPDTDGDGHLDGADAFPLDPTRWQMPAPDPSDHTPPLITLLEPVGAVPLP